MITLHTLTLRLTQIFYLAKISDGTITPSDILTQIKTINTWANNNISDINLLTNTQADIDNVSARTIESMNISNAYNDYLILYSKSSVEEWYNTNPSEIIGWTLSEILELFGDS